MTRAPEICTMENVCHRVPRNAGRTRDPAPPRDPDVEHVCQRAPPIPERSGADARDPDDGERLLDETSRIQHEPSLTDPRVRRQHTRERPRPPALGRPATFLEVISQPSEPRSGRGPTGVMKPLPGRRARTSIHIRGGRRCASLTIGVDPAPRWRYLFSRGKNTRTSCRRC